ncbi:hypothetical protein [Komagataeibacter diospyri]|uniref:hypothetical protein n=1 Tax=Komagataeibacter diospyri TaxID=1932662 RepID=UPI0037581DFB
MCSSEELIHDARQVDLEEAIKMTNEQYYLIRLPLTDGQETNIRREFLEGPILDPAHMFAHLMGIVGTPIQPCADVETVGFVPDKSNLFVDKRLPMTNIYRSAGDPWPAPLVRRTDMEAQVARVKASSHLNAEKILTCIMQDVQELPDRTSPDDQPDLLLVTVDELEGIIRAALNEGAA